MLIVFAAAVFVLVAAELQRNTLPSEAAVANWADSDFDMACASVHSSGSGGGGGDRTGGIDAEG